jgi:hypothetical protein
MRSWRVNEKKMSNEEILKVDFYDLCGIGSIMMSDDDKIKCWREVVENKVYNSKTNQYDKRRKGNLSKKEVR